MTLPEIGNQKPLRVVVCGATFGQFYMRALSGVEDLKLAGILSRGSVASRACAARYGAPLWTDIDQIPEDVDLACVVVRSGVLGGEGSLLARQLMQRGVHVLQEAPLHHEELAACIRESRKHAVQYQIANLYSRLPAVKAFIAASRVVLRGRGPLFLDISCSSAVLSPLLHVLSLVLGSIRPWSIDSLEKDPSPLKTLVGRIGGTPFTLRVDNRVDPTHSDNRVSRFHRVELGVNGGRLILSDSHGAVEWMPELELPHSVFTTLDFETPEAKHLSESASEVFFRTKQTSFREILLSAWPSALREEVLSIREKIRGHAKSSEDHQRWLAICRAWQDLTTALGYPEEIPSLSVRPLDRFAVLTEIQRIPSP